MKTFTDIGLLQAYIQTIKTQSNKIAFIPTMGAFHEGHLSLIKFAKEHYDKVAVSIFVNPTQFGPNEDFLSYPRTIETDRSLLKSLDVDILFIPTKSSIYPDVDTFTTVGIPNLDNIYCGSSRPLFFRGVCSVVLRLFNIITPDYALFGLKDFQQYTLIKKMVHDLFLPISIIGRPIIRDSTGLALSSRNSYLNSSQRQDASSIFRSLRLAREYFIPSKKCSYKELTELINTHLSPNITLDYCVIVDKDTLKQVNYPKSGNRILFAGSINRTRLIDNIEL